MTKPYTEEYHGGDIIRTFDFNVTQDELVWHRDKEDRFITIINGPKWQLQIDNELPMELKLNERYFIPKETYHRLIKGNSNLIVKIERC